VAGRGTVGTSPDDPGCSSENVVSPAELAATADPFDSRDPDPPGPGSVCAAALDEVGDGGG